MQHEKKNFVYLHRSSQTNGTGISVRNSQSDGHFLCSKRCEIYTAVCEPCAMVVMALAVPFEDLSGRKHHTAFSFVVHRSNFKQMKHTNKTAWRDTQSITFKADWLDFTEHLSNAQVGRLLRCVARYERGDINPAHVAELRKDAAVGVAYNFITDQMERRARL